MNIIVNFGVKINQGTKLEIIEPIATINERKVSQRFLDRYILTLVDQLDLNRLEADGIITRVLQFQVGDEEINLASFISLEQLPVIARSAR